MRTQLSQFCDHFVSTVQPLLAPLGTAIDVFAAEPDAHRGELQAELADLRHQVQSLCDKVAGQRSYVLIFGPLKSGKSTLMNAIAESYVSEVSSLPAYPCLVFVSHGPHQEFVVADYEGRVETYTDPGSLHQRIDSAHQELAEHIRQAEDGGEVFEPQRHFPRALRRVDVKVAAPNLQTSGAVLVDTPGLYTRMRFGYDRMTREFRNAAACAIFVVKSDTLFLEQVFDEFTQLLELFSRVFLVVNMDTHKRDVGPDGKLVPSLEKSSPERIIAAFENLAMPTPLRRAAADGRVQIYPVDLLNAASLCLQGRPVTAPDFIRFRDDLHAYLASTDYLFAFLKDSMQRAQHLVDEADQLSSGTFISELRETLAHAEEQRHEYQSELDQVIACRTLNWDPSFASFAAELRDSLVRVSRDVGARVARDMSAAIETWFLSSHSLHWLLSTVWEPLIADYHRALDDAARRCLDQSLAQTDAGLAIPDNVAYFLRAIEIDVTAVRRAAVAKLDDQGPPVPPPIPLDTDQIPVRRGVLDVLTLRNETKVRDRLFGPTEAPDVKIPARLKAARLGNAAKRYLNQFLLTFKDEFFKNTIKTTEQRYAGRLANLTTNHLHKLLQDREPGLRQRIELLELQARSLRRILTPLDQLAGVGAEVRSKVHALDSQFSATEPDDLLTPRSPRAAGATASRRRTADSGEPRDG